jgi:hypothetical protein
MRGVLEIAMALIGVATITLLVNRASDAATLIDAAGGTFNNLLRTVTLQDQYGNFATRGR